MVKCLDCDHLLQLFMTPCHGKIFEAQDFQNALEFLSTWDFTCDLHEITLSRVDIENERECKNFDSILSVKTVSESEKDGQKPKKKW